MKRLYVLNVLMLVLVFVLGWQVHSLRNQVEYLDASLSLFKSRPQFQK